MDKQKQRENLNYNNNQKVLSIEQTFYITYDIIKGLQYIHSKNLIHRDIKAENILLSNIKSKCSNSNQIINNKYDYITKICDFGFARSSDQNQQISTYCGTTIYMAPQILANQNYNQKVDIWSLGVLIFYMLFGQFPFKGLNIQYQIEKKCTKGFKASQVIKEKQFTKNQMLTKNDLIKLDQFFKRIFVINPDKRITLQQIKQYDWFKQYQLNSNNNLSYENQKSKSKSTNPIIVKNQTKINEIFKHKLPTKLMTIKSQNNLQTLDKSNRNKYTISLSKNKNNQIIINQKDNKQKQMKQLKKQNQNKLNKRIIENNLNNNNIEIKNKQKMSLNKFNHIKLNKSPQINKKISIQTTNQSDSSSLQQFHSIEFKQKNNKNNIKNIQNDYDYEKYLFVKDVILDVQLKNFLKLSQQIPFKYYMYKMMYSQFYKILTKNNPKQLEILISNLNKSTKLMDLNIKKIQISKFTSNLYQPKFKQFTQFKQAYRLVIGHIFSQAHKNITDDIQKRSQIKLKLFICHAINRVFNPQNNQGIFLHYQNFIQKLTEKNNKIQNINFNKINVNQNFKKIRINFNLFKQWIKTETSQKLVQTVEFMNLRFYKGK